MSHIARAPRECLDSDRIDVTSYAQLNDWANRLETTTAKLKEAVANAGASADAVRHYLSRHKESLGVSQRTPAMNVTTVYSELITLSEETRAVLAEALDLAAFESLADARHANVKMALTPQRQGELTSQVELYRRLALWLRDSLSAH